MPSRKDPTSKRLFKLFEELEMVTSPKALDLVRDRLLSEDGTTEEEANPDFDDRLTRLVASQVALTLGQLNDYNTPILRAFEAAGLDHRNPLHWRSLLRCFCQAHFGKRKTKPITWSPYLLSAVFKDYRDVKGAYPTIEDSALCRFLRTDKKYKKRYGRYSFHTLRKIVRYAKNPKHNPAARYPEMNNLLLQELRWAGERNHNLVWNEEFERRLAELSISLLEENKSFSPEMAEIARDELAKGSHDANGSAAAERNAGSLIPGPRPDTPTDSMQ
jgi:hypothetical protein